MEFKLQDTIDSTIQEDEVQVEAQVEAQDEAQVEAQEEKLTPAEQVAHWRELYKKLYLSVYDEQEFIWRKIKRNEYVAIMEAEELGEIDDIVEYRQMLMIRQCLLSPAIEELDSIIEEYPGILTSLSAEMLRKSGFSKPLTVEL